MKRVVLAIVFALVAASCEGVTSDRIQQWKSTQKGPGKLQDALKDSSLSPKLRAEAAAALVDIGMADEVEQAMAAVPADHRWEILKTLVPIYVAQMKTAELTKARTARDALFGVRAYAPPEEQKQIDAVLLPSIEKDLREGRVGGGRHSLDKMLAALGPAAGPMLVTLLEDPRVPFQGVAELLERVGDDAARERGGVALIKRALATPDVPVALWRALGTMGGKPATAFLVEKVQKGFEKDAVAAAQALQQRRDPTLLPLALKIASDPKANRAVRDEMFGLAEKIGGLEAQRGLIRIIASDPNELVRYRAYEAALAVGKGDAVVPALEAFPAKAAYKKDDVVDFLVKDITKLGPEAKLAVTKALASPAPLARMTAVLALEAPLPSDPRASLGRAADAPAVLKLAGDKGSVKGFPAGNTVGKEAARVAGLLQKRS
jgi:HEAT repeat protein